MRPYKRPAAAWAAGAEPSTKRHHSISDDTFDHFRSLVKAVLSLRSALRTVDGGVENTGETGIRDAYQTIAKSLKTIDEARQTIYNAVQPALQASETPSNAAENISVAIESRLQAVQPASEPSETPPNAVFGAMSDVPEPASETVEPAPDISWPLPKIFKAESGVQRPPSEDEFNQIFDVDPSWKLDGQPPNDDPTDEEAVNNIQSLKDKPWTNNKIRPHAICFKACIRNFGCLLTDIIGIEYFLFAPQPMVWSQPYYLALRPVLASDIWFGDRNDLAMTLQFSVITRTSDRRIWPLRNSTTDPFVKALVDEIRNDAKESRPMRDTNQLIDAASNTISPHARDKSAFRKLFLGIRKIHETEASIQPPDPMTDLRPLIERGYPCTQGDLETIHKALQAYSPEIHKTRANLPESYLPNGKPRDWMTKAFHREKAKRRWMETHFKSALKQPGPENSPAHEHQSGR
ncbi:hypothetical protein B0T16DRAFT_509201 [Cercophora newfieldiana]|uniref:Uncharacterized protein n=1 Tax=Cercophora newfieldiana TaxID=92897 RepID=A0AA39Y4W0_9PEZI|nr:hypothetical protein B0T16DRAFT_509201 [Cercophora newfieldiana]